jgi:hypothetical protein
LSFDEPLDVVDQQRLADRHRLVGDANSLVSLMREDEFVHRHALDDRFPRRSNLRAGTEQLPEPGAYASHDGKESTRSQLTGPSGRALTCGMPRP